MDGTEVVPVSLTRRGFLQHLGTAAAAGIANPLTGAPAEGGRRPKNVVFICLDTVRADRLGCYGYERNTSPNVDALAKRSVVFDDALSPSSWTLPVLASVITGEYPHEHGALYFRTPIRDSSVRLPEVLGQAGMATAAMGQFPFHFDFYQFQRGFESYEQKWSLLAPKTTGQVRRWLDERAKDRRGFFLWTHYFEPHVPYEFQIDSVGFYNTAYRGKTTKVFDANLILKYRDEGTPQAKAELARIHDLYDGEIFCADKYVGWILKELRRLGLADSTMVIIMSDHGEHFGEHGIVEHGNTLYEELVRVPLIVHAPGCKPGRCEQCVSTVDLFPTMLDFFELPARQSSGISLMPALSGSRLPDRPLFTTLDTATSVIFVPDGSDPSKIQAKDKIIKNIKAVRSGKKKLIYDVQARCYELYDLATDPKEQKNLVAGNKPPSELRQLLDDWLFAMERNQPTISAPNESVIEAMRSLGYIQ